MYQVNPLFQKVITIPRSSRKGKKRRPEKTYCPEDDKLNWAWYNPPEESVPVSFCLDTSLHGLKYLGQQRRHIFERFFWLAAFVASVVTSAILIYGMWTDYRNMPIITVFNPTEKNLDAIPFPSVTICNVNGYQKSSLDQQSLKILGNLGKKAMNIIPTDELLHSLATFVDMNLICDTSLTFIDRIVGNTTIMKRYHEIKVLISKNLNEIKNYMDPITTIRKVAQPCERMILHCIWLDTVKNCSELFQPIETDYGHCCTFNAVPASLLLRNHTDKRDRPEVVEEWKAASLDYENVMFTEETDNRTYPRRQRYPGRLAGLSLLLNPDLNEYVCTNTDSEGFIMGINVPLDFPRMKDDGLAIKTNAEVFVGVRPEITMSEDSLTSYSLKKRNCYYGNEYSLQYYTIYTTSNCMAECIAKKTLKYCGCLRFYMPHSEPQEICKPENYNCTEKVQEQIISNGLSKVCKECLPTCTEINYHKEVTLLRLREKKVKTLIQESKESFNGQDVSIVHVYFNADSVYPRLRKQLTSITQLMSNTGGLLGLCMGFSVLSLLEIFYYGTLRLCCSFYRDKTIKDHNVETGMDNKRNCDDQVDNPINPKQSWFTRFFNATSGVWNIDNNKRRKKSNRESIEDDEENHVFKVPNKNKLPEYFRGTFEDQFQRAFLESFPETGFAYPK